MGTESTRAKIQVKISDIQSPPLLIVPHPPSAWTSPGTWTSQDTGELRVMASPLGAPSGAAWHGRQRQVSVHEQEARVGRVLVGAGPMCVQGPGMCAGSVCAGDGLSSKPWAFPGLPGALLLFLPIQACVQSPPSQGGGQGWG